MLEVVISGIHRADEDDIWGIEALEHPVQVWEAIKYSSPAIKSSGSPYYIESFHNGSVLRVYKFDGTPIILTLPDNIRLCRLASQEK